jgi:hypothetical protein
VQGVADDVWADLIRSLGGRLPKVRHTHKLMTDEVLNAVQVLSYRITTIGLEAELVRNYPAIENSNRRSCARTMKSIITLKPTAPGFTTRSCSVKTVSTL